jgi:8-oxo-dGTP diphosphatase
MMQILVVVAAALFDAKGRVLVQQRPPGKPMEGLWEFPGGKIDSGETPERALVRELNEELGIHVDPADLAPAIFASAPIAGSHLLLLLFVLRHWRGDPAPLHARALRWVAADDLASLPMPPADYPLIPVIQHLATIR